jgi:hypothetical protein
MKKLLPISVFLLSALAVSATPVLFSSQSLTGSVNNRSILVQPDRVQNPLVLGTNLVPVFDFSVQPVGGQVITNLLPWGYTITVSGWPRSAHIIVPDSTNTINVATLINTNAFAPLNIYLTGSSGGGLPVTNNGVTWFYDSLGGLRWTNTANGANGLLGYDGHVKFTDQFGNVIKSDTNGLAVNGNYVLTAIPTTYALKSDVTNITAAFMSGLTNLTMPFYLTGQDTDGGATSPGRLKFYEGTIFGQPESFGMRADPNFDLDFITSAAGTIFFYYADTTNLMLHLGPAGAIFNETVTAPNYATSQGAFIASDSSVELFDSIYGGDVFRWLVGGNDFAMFGTNGSYIRILPNPVINGFIITNMVGRIVNANLPVGNAPGTFTNTAPIQAAQVVGVVTNAQFAKLATNAPDGNVSASLNNATNIAATIYSQNPSNYISPTTIPAYVLTNNGSASGMVFNRTNYYSDFYNGNTSSGNYKSYQVGDTVYFVGPLGGVFSMRENSGNPLVLNGDGSQLINIRYAKTLTSTNISFVPTVNPDGSTNWTATITNLPPLPTLTGSNVISYLVRTPRIYSTPGGIVNDENADFPLISGIKGNFYPSGVLHCFNFDFSIFASSPYTNFTLDARVYVTNANAVLNENISLSIFTNGLNGGRGGVYQVTANSQIFSYGAGTNDYDMPTKFAIPNAIKTNATGTATFYFYNNGTTNFWTGTVIVTNSPQ